MNMHVGSPQKGAQAIPSGLAAQEQTRVETLQTLRRLRKEASAEIERLIAFMDETDGYTMTEQEPSHGGSYGPHSHSGQDDLEGDDSEFEDGNDDEPSLGFRNPLTAGDEGWAEQPWLPSSLDQESPQGGCEDFELDDSDLEDGHDAEPSLCGIHAGWRAGDDCTDLEAEPEHDEDGNDAEPSLGSLSSNGGSQAHWGERGQGALDAEDEHDGGEPDDDEGAESLHEDGEEDDPGEPSLGWTIDGVLGAFHDGELSYD